MKKVLCVIIAFIMAMVNTCGVFASEQHGEKASIVCRLNYVFDENTQNIIESGIIVIGDEKINIETIVRKNGDSKLTISEGNFCEVKNIQLDYDLYTKLYRESRTFKLQGCNISKKNFKHLKLGTTSFTIDSSDFSKMSSAANAFSVIVGKIKHPLASSAAGIASTVSAVTGMMSIGADKIVVKSTSNEVRFKSDNNYYTHCYHDIIKSYKNGKCTSTKRTYYQSNGG